MKHLIPRVSSMVIALAALAALPVAGECAHAASLPGSRLLPAPSIVRSGPINVDANTVRHAITGDPVCGDQLSRQRPERRRFRGPLGWLLRSTRDAEIERTGRVFPFYLRSPLLSGVYGCPPDAEREHELPEECAAVTIRTEALEDRTIEILLPQLEARSARQLEKAIERGMGSGAIVTVMLATGDSFSIDPATARGVSARACRGVAEDVS